MVISMENREYFLGSKAKFYELTDFPNNKHKHLLIDTEMTGAADVEDVKTPLLPTE